MLLLAISLVICIIFISLNTKTTSVPSNQLQWKEFQSFLNSSHITNGSFIKTALSRTCNCHSMFTIGACGMTNVVALKPHDSPWQSGLEGLERARLKGDKLMMPHLQTLARYLTPLFKINAIPAKENSSLNVTYERHLSRTTQKLPFLTCLIHVYTPSEVHRCTKRYLTNTGHPIRLAFVGDSRVRNTMQQMIRSTFSEISYHLLGEFKNIDMSMKFLDEKIKNNLPVEGEGIELRLHWATFLEKNRDPEDVSQQGAHDLLRAWASDTPSPEDGPIPDVVYIAAGLWDAFMLPEDLAVESYVRILEILAPAIKKLAQKTSVIWHIHEPEKEWLAIRDIPNGALDMMNRASWQWLGDSDVWLWDTHTVLTLRGHAECHRYYQAGLHKLVPREWGCLDFAHAGWDVEDAAGNMIWNLVCNSPQEFGKEYCC